MSPSRSGIKGPLRLKIGAVLLLITSLLATIIQAAPVPAAHAALTTSPVTVCDSDKNFQHDWPCKSGGCIRADRSESTAQFSSGLSTKLPGDYTSIQSIYGREVFGKGKVDTVVLVRRGLGAKIKAAFHKTGQKIKHAFQKVGHAIKTGFQKVGHAIKTAAQKVGHFIKTTGAKIAKVALKIVSTAGKIVSKVVGVIPGVGKVVGKAIEGVSEGLNKASDAIPAHIGGKLGQAMDRMSKAQHIVGKIP